MAWTWYHWIPNWASAANANTICEITTGTEHEFYPAQNLVDDNPFSYCLFTPGSGTTVHFTLTSVGMPSALTHLALVSDDLPSNCTIQYEAWRGNELVTNLGESRGTDEIYIKSFGSMVSFANWKVKITSLTSYTWYKMGLIVIAREEEFGDQPTQPYRTAPVLDGVRRDNPAGRPFLFLRRSYWTWTLNWRTSMRATAVTRDKNYERVLTDRPFMIWDPVIQQYFFVRFTEPLETKLDKAFGGTSKIGYNYLYSLRQRLAEAI